MRRLEDKADEETELEPEVNGMRAACLGGGEGVCEACCD